MSSSTRHDDLKLAGDAVHGIVPSAHWNALDAGCGRGGSPEFPLRTTVEKRIKPVREILKLKNPEVRIEPTNLCNYHCVMCPRESQDREKGVMPMEFYRSLVDEVGLMGAKQITIVNFGEPFMDPSFEDKVDYARGKDMKIYTISNGSLWHMPSTSRVAARHGGQVSRIEAAIMAGLTEMRLSFYGTDRKSYEAIMRGGDFVQVERNIRLFLEARAKFGREIVSPTTGQKILSPELSVYFLELEAEVDRTEAMDRFIEYTRDFADYLEIWRPHNFGKGRNYRQLQPEKKSCGRASAGPVQINWNGIVVPCCYDYNDDIPLGNAAVQTIEEILRGPAYARFREVHRDGDFRRIPYCDNCDQLCRRDRALILSTNAKHKGRSNEDIMKSPNTLAGFVMEESAGGTGKTTSTGQSDA